MGQIVYLVLCMLVGLFAIGQRGGFFLYFILSVAMSPLVGLLILLIASPAAPRAARQAPQSASRQ